MVTKAQLWAVELDLEWEEAMAWVWAFSLSGVVLDRRLDEQLWACYLAQLSVLEWSDSESMVPR